MSHDPSVWVTALLTLAVFSFLWRENPVFRFAEHLLVGVSAGYYVVQYFYSGIVKKMIVPARLRNAHALEISPNTKSRSTGSL